MAEKEGVCKVQARRQFFELLPFTDRLWAETQCSRQVWKILAEKMRLSTGLVQILESAMQWIMGNPAEPWQGGAPEAED